MKVAQHFDDKNTHRNVITFDITKEAKWELPRKMTPRKI